MYESSQISKIQINETDSPEGFVYFYRGQFYLEYFVSAIPCYIFVITFIIRYLAIKDLGFPKRLSFGYLLIFKIIFTMGIMFLRLLQIFQAFDDYNPEDPYSSNPFYSLFYLQFVAAHGLSLYLSVLQHLKRLPEVCYCQNMFWGLSFTVQLIFIKVHSSQLSLMYDVALVVLKGCLFLISFVK